MDFQLSEDQAMLADTVASFAKQSSPIERARKLREDERGWDAATWKQMGELGWLSVPFPESLDGFGGTFVDVAVVLQKLAATLVPEPFVPSILAGLAIADAGSEEQQKRFLPPLIAGDTSLALAWAEEDSRYNPAHISTRAEPDGDDFVLTGNKRWVDNGHAADHLVVSAKCQGGIGLFVVDKDQVTVAPVRTMDGRRAAMISLDGVKVARDRLLGTPEEGAAHLQTALDRGAAAACAEGAGIMETVLQMTVEYLKEREQFGVPIGVFQVLQHRAVDMFIETEMSKSMMWLSAVRASDGAGGDRARDVSAAKAQLGRGGRFVVQQAIQLHGGIGVTDEHDVGLYFKRLEVLNQQFGNEAFHLNRFFAETAQ